MNHSEQNPETRYPNASEAGFHASAGESNLEGEDKESFCPLGSLAPPSLLAPIYCPEGHYLKK